MKVPLNRVNTILFIAIVCINGYIIAAPFAARFGVWEQRTSSAHIAALEHSVNTANDAPASTAPTIDRIIIPAMGLEEPIHTGPNARTLRQGLWLRPQGSTPDKGSNTVIVGHRFTYTNPRGTLYYLDKVQVGDIIGVSWSGVMHRYAVKSVQIVAADQTSIEAPTTQSQLTIYTCTPLWLPKDRLVVIAEEV